MTLLVSRYRTGFTVMLIAALLGGCSNYGGLHPEEALTAPDSLHAARSLAGVKLDAAAWPQQDWWKAVGDPQLDKLVSEALSNSPDVALVNARVRAALAAAGASNADRKPTLNAGASIAGARVPPLLPPIANGHFGTIRYGYLSFAWDLDLWGGQRAAWEAAVGNARAAEVTGQAVRLRLSADVVQAYFNLAGAYTQRKLAQAELHRARDFLDLTKKRVANGIDSRFTLTRIKGETATARVHVEAADNAVRTSELMLTALLGAGPDRAFSIPQPSLPAIPALSIPGNLPADLLGRRPDVVAARWRVEAAGREIKAAKTKFLPNLSISSLAGLIAPTALNFFALSNRFYTISPAVSLPIFEGGRLRNNLAAKDAARDIAVAQYNQTLVHAINQVAQSVEDLHSLDLQAEDAEIARQSAADAYKLAMQRYRSGVGNFLEALSVRRELITAEQQLAILQMHRGDAWATLNEALGGGFQPAEDAPSLAATPAQTSAPKANR